MPRPVHALEIRGEQATWLSRVAKTNYRESALIPTSSEHVESIRKFLVGPARWKLEAIILGLTDARDSNGFALPSLRVSLSLFLARSLAHLDELILPITITFSSHGVYTLRLDQSRKLARGW